VTDLASERLPTCFQRTFAGHVDTLDVRDAASLQAGSPQQGVVQRLVSSAIGRVIERSTLQAGTRVEHSRYAYDRLGQLLSIDRYLDPVGDTDAVTWSRQLDSTGNTLQLMEPETAVRAFSYSDWGEPLETSWIDGTVHRTLARSYDALSRLTGTEERNDGVTDPATVNSYAYDTPVNVTPLVAPTFVLGQLARATSPSGQLTFSYDALGRANAEVFTDNQAALHVEKTERHADGRLASLEYRLPDQNYAQEVVKYGYDSAGRLRTMKFADPSGGRDLYNADGIDLFGRVRSALYGSNTKFRTSYAAEGRRLVQEARIESPSGSRTITFGTFDPVGRELSRREVKNDATDGLTTNFSYEALGRLASATRSNASGTLFNWSFAYDALGNVHALSNSVGPVNSNLTYRTLDRDRVCRIRYGGFSWPWRCNVAHDALGNIVSQPTRTGSRQLSYFLSGGVRTIAQDGNQASFAYDPFGRMQTLDVQDGSGQSVHESHYGKLIERRESTSAGTTTSLITRNIPGPGGILASRRGATDDWVFEFSEQRGRRFFSKQDGMFVQDIDYQPFGEAQSTGAPVGSADYTSYQWNSGKALAAFGLSHLGARLYDPVIGRFLSRDPLLVPRSAATSNPYAFSMNDPVNGADPSGLDSCGGDDLCITSNYQASQDVDAAAAMGAAWAMLDFLAGYSKSNKPTLQADPVLRQVFDDAYNQRYDSQAYLGRVHNAPGSGQIAAALLIGMPVKMALQAGCDFFACDQETGGGDTLVPDGHGGLRPDSYQPHHVSYARQVFNVGLNKFSGKALWSLIFGKPSSIRPSVLDEGDFGESGGGTAGPGEPAGGGGEPPRMWGPYAHTLNKGGLQSIMQSRQLMATLGRYGDIAARGSMAPRGFSAYQGFFAEGETTLIYRTFEKPRFNEPQEWALVDRPNEGDMVDIVIDEIHLSY
jgi:RHS repeat-associated protein